MVFRRTVIDLNELFKYTMQIDAVLYYVFLKKGKGYCMPDVMGVYRVHDAGVWSSLNLNHQRMFSLKARKAIYDVEKTDEAALFILSQFSRPMGRRSLLSVLYLCEITKMLTAISDFDFCIENIS